MAERYTDPWADATNQAVGALYKYYLSKPSAADLQRSQMENQLLDLKIKGSQADLEKQKFDMSKLQFEHGQAQREKKMADLFAQQWESVPPVQGPVPTGPDQMGPLKPVTQTDRNSAFANLYEQFAPKLSKDTVEASRDAMGAANAMRFDDPIQRQLAMDEKATSYENMMPGYTLAPGNVRFGADNKEIAKAPFKTGGGSYIQQPDGTIISIDGGGPGLTTSVQTDLQGKDIAFDTYRSFTDSYKTAIQDNPGGVGTRGNIARIADGLLGQVEQFAPNTEFSNMLKQVVNTTAGQYTDPQTGQIMNADLYDAATTASLLPFVAAEAIVGQGGRSLSNEDRELVKIAVGGPEDWMATPDKLMARMNQLDRIVENLRQKYQGRLTGQRPFTPPPGVDPLTMGGGGVVKWGLDDQGNPVPLGGQ
jgi:hypothetical protein